ncbi:hypothetical protein SAMN04487969_11839 [Paenibacillus algorifonticola]|uniref:Uncharacterized protein n=1 Tax=Paenibacillus algorifonticola TaxID=684063 RepID=A0A1I2GUI1_9BACL|nr:hypothetical protein SAMN04487969_11839 [Paenibacillus algorifonticola]
MLSHIRKLMIGALLLSALLWTSSLQLPQAAAMPETENAVDTALLAHVEAWTAQLSAQPAFKSWQGATLDISALGPGTHSWMASVIQHKKTVGYLVVHATQSGGFILGEYGLGDYLYNLTTLQQSLQRLELIPSTTTSTPLYIHPLLSVWKISGKATAYTDAMSGEAVPLTASLWNAEASQELKLIQDETPPMTSTAGITKAVSNPSFSPYEKLQWLTDAPVSKAESKAFIKVLHILDKKKHLTYTAARFNGEMLYVWSATGYHSWDNGAVYVALETDELGESQRYVPLSLLAELGDFYR